MGEKDAIIELKHIVKRFLIDKPNELEILHGIDLQVKEGEYRLADVNVCQAKDKRLSKIRNQQIGFVFQTYNLIARAMANNPSIILADEPTGALDSETGRLIMDIFHKLHEEQGKTIVLITHSKELAEETQRIVTLKDGRIVDERGGSLAC